MVGLNEVDDAFVGEIVGAGVGASVGGMVGEEDVMISGQFNRAESPTLSSRANRLVSMAPLSLAVSSLVKRAVSLAGPLLLVAVLSLAAAATVASLLPLLFDKPTPNPMMSTKMAVPATAHPIRYDFWLGAGWTAG